MVNGISSDFTYDEVRYLAGILEIRAMAYQERLASAWEQSDKRYYIEKVHKNAQILRKLRNIMEQMEQKL